MIGSRDRTRQCGDTAGFDQPRDISRGRPGRVSMEEERLF